MDESPSLKSRLEAAIETGLPLATFPETCLYLLVDLLNPEVTWEDGNDPQSG
ncbi:DUF29 domain-containing protein [Synechococcus elongatus]|uniref:DUF29 domain-containing protein n=1 Tax=Synechococcus elongatus PCC 11801 TaxID=2219813 RepID=A0AAQ3MEN0_SYNEL|nr:DUF29 domain-containing protein [Synechococcus elongatus]